MPAPLPRMRRGELVAAVRAVAAEVGDGLSLDEFVRRSGITHRAVWKVFPKWSDLRVAAGLGRQNRTGPPRYTDEELLRAFDRVAQRLLRVPTCADFERYGAVSWPTMQHRFGSKGEVLRRWRALIIEERRIMEDRTVLGIPIQREVTQREIAWMRERWQELRIGFETHSHEFRDRHPGDVDVLIVLSHDWPDCPVPVLEWQQLITPANYGRPPQSFVMPEVED